MISKDKKLAVIEELDSAAASYAKEVVGLLNEQMLSVIKIRKPDILDYFGFS